MKLPTFKARLKLFFPHRSKTHRGFEVAGWPFFTNICIIFSVAKLNTMLLPAFWRSDCFPLAALTLQKFFSLQTFLQFMVKNSRRLRPELSFYFWRCLDTITVVTFVLSKKKWRERQVEKRLLHFHSRNCKKWRPIQLSNRLQPDPFREASFSFSPLSRPLLAWRGWSSSSGSISPPFYLSQQPRRPWFPIHYRNPSLSPPSLSA